MRNLRLEGLEDRQLLAGDVVGSLPYHNPLIAEDVDYDFNVSPRDVLLIVNELNRNGSHELDQGPVDPNGKAFLDVNGDGSVSPIDALSVVNYLNGEGETDPLVTYTAQLTDTAGTPISQVVVGQTFRLNVFVQDTRATNPEGVFQNAIDVGVTGDGGVDFPLVSQDNFLDNLFFGSPDPTVNDEYVSFPQGNFGADADRATELLDAVSSTWNDFFDDKPGTGVLPFFQTDFEATTAGTVNFVLNGHEIEEEPASQVAVFDQGGVLPDGGRIDPSMISYQTVSINVITDPTAPTANNDNVTTDEDTDLLLVGGSVDLIANDSIEDGRTATVVSVNAIQGETEGTLDGFTYSPPTNQSNFTDLVTYTIEDSAGLRSTATVTITVNPVNDPPIANNDALAVDEESSDNPLDVLANDSPGPNETTDSLTIVEVTTPVRGSVTIAADGLTVLYTPPVDFIGEDSFNYTVRDSGGLEASATVTVDVEATVLPRARRDTANATEDGGQIEIDVLENDRANTGQTKFLVGLASQPANGTVSVNQNGTPDDATDDTIFYTPNDNFSGTDTFTYEMNDTGDGSQPSVGTVSVQVAAVNDPVIINDDTGIQGVEDQVTTISFTSLFENDSPGVGEDDEQTLSPVSVQAGSDDATVEIVGGNVILTPADNFFGDFTFTYTATDDGDPASTGTATVFVNIAAVNDDPVAGNDTVSATEDTAATISLQTLLANDTPGPGESDTLFIGAVSVTSAQGGTVTSGSTDIVYTPATNFNGTDTFTYTLGDGQGGSATGTVTINVQPVNDAPTGVADSVRAFKDNAATILAEDLLSNDSPGPADEAGQTLSIDSVGDAVNGTVVLNSDGTITFTPAAGHTGAASFTYVILDSAGATSDPVTVNVNVEEFEPTEISGTVWLDENNNGVIDSAKERRAGGIEITLRGTTLGEAIEPITVMTLADGSYNFENLGPGQYIVSMAMPAHLIDGHDVAGTLGDMDSASNQFTINVEEPGGADASGYNFAFRGVEAQRGRILDQLASRYTRSRPGKLDGALFAIGMDNSERWSALMDGFDGVQFAEAVLSSDGSQLVLSVVDSNEVIHSAVLGSRDFVKYQVDGDYLIRVIGKMSDFDFQVVQNGATPPVTAAGYLDAIDEVFGQEGWGDE